MGAEVAAGRTPIIDEKSKTELAAGLQQAKKTAPQVAANFGFNPVAAKFGMLPPVEPPQEWTQAPSLDDLRAQGVRSPALDRVTPTEWAKVSNDPNAMIDLILKKNEEARISSAAPVRAPPQVDAPDDREVSVASIRERVIFGAGVLTLSAGLVWFAISGLRYAESTPSVEYKFLQYDQEREQERGLDGMYISAPFVVIGVTVVAVVMYRKKK